MKTYEHAIDDLLESVETKLISSYESINLKGESLRRINRECKRAASERSKEQEAAMTLGIAMSVSLMLWLSLPQLGIPVWVAILSTCLLVAPAIRWCIKEVNKSSLNEKVLSQDTILDMFRETIKAVSSPVGATEWRYTEESIRQNFVTHAVRILEGEMRLDQVRLQAERRVHDILHIANWLQGCQAVFEKAIPAAARFGLEFDKRELFVEAKKHLERSYAR